MPIGDGEISRALHELYCSESAQHLAALEQELRALHTGEHPPSSAGIRAAHTLAGISGTVRSEAAHRLGRALEHRLERLADTGQAPGMRALALFGEALDALCAMREEIAAGRTPEPADTLVTRLEAVDEEEVTKPAGRAEEAIGAADTVSATAIPPAADATPAPATLPTGPAVGELVAHGEAQTGGATPLGATTGMPLGGTSLPFGTPTGSKYSSAMIGHWVIGVQNREFGWLDGSPAEASLLPCSSRPDGVQSRPFQSVR